MTLTAMEAYDAKRVGGWRNPFPIYIPQDDAVIAKNIMVQLYRGRNPGARPWVMPSRDALKRRKRLLNLVKFSDFLDKDNAKEVKKSLLTRLPHRYASPPLAGVYACVCVDSRRLLRLNSEQ